MTAGSCDEGTFSFARTLVHDACVTLASLYLVGRLGTLVAEMSVCLGLLHVFKMSLYLDDLRVLWIQVL